MPNQALEDCRTVAHKGDSERAKAKERREREISLQSGNVEVRE